ncbi:MAG: 1-acyl-sn-glycerol-3-phosphate acyltransferase, partial [Planctomycetota bacterium]|nr:1-acyl-sn-glycerol-3-phosphate acyltransferase [Planctomycetota bacterium]
AIYSRCDVPVVPVALNTGSFWARRTLRKNPGKVIIEFLPPIEPGLERKAFQALLEETIEDATEKLELESPGPKPAGD